MSPQLKFLRICPIVVVLLNIIFPCSIIAQINFRPGNQQQQQQQRADIIFDDSPIASSPSCITPEQRPGLCKSLAECAIFFAEIPSLLENPCNTGNGQGICCPTESSQVSKPPRPGVGSNGLLNKPPPPNVPVPKLSPQQIQRTVDNGIKSFEQREQITNRILFQDKITVPKGTPADKHQIFFTTTNQILDQGNKAQLNIEASKNLVNEFKLSKLQGTFALPQISARNTPIANNCPPVSQCRPNFPYRTMDGSCNNVQNPDWGKSGTAFQRILPPQYGDGVSSPRTIGNSDLQLPSPRVISSKLIPDVDRQYSNITLMVMQWGQFLDHDLTHTPIVKGPNSTSISCCSNGQPLPKESQHPDCFPISIPADDPFFGRFNQRCMDFVRSLPAPRRECNFGPREQMSQITGFIDGSNVYGSNDRKASSLREGTLGRLRAQKSFGKDLMPGNPNECSDGSGSKFCFRAGDLRVNEQVELAVMHTVWLREHNRIAEILNKLNPNWNDEILYQETRRIVIGEMQHITYNEFLPLILGPEYMRTFSLHPVPRGHTNLYNTEVDPSITNAFATAAYRFGHSLVQGIIKGFNQFGSISKSLTLEETQFKPFEVYNELDSFVRGLATQECQRFDNFVSRSLTEHLFQGSSSFGLDLVALNIQRGRDHGLPPYNDWREVCGLPRVTSWNELRKVMSPKSVDILQSVYTSVEDIDLYPAALSENPLEGAILGPVFVCLVGDQFARLRRGDRFFYEEKTSRFTEAQLNQIRKVSLARVLCDNSNEITVIQPLVMQQASFLNRRVLCTTDAIPGIDFRFWTESKTNNNNNNNNQEQQQGQGNRKPNDLFTNQQQQGRPNRGENQQQQHNFQQNQQQQQQQQNFQQNRPQQQQQQNFQQNRPQQQNQQGFQNFQFQQTPPQQQQQNFQPNRPQQQNQQNFQQGFQNFRPPPQPQTNFPNPSQFNNRPQQQFSPNPQFNTFIPGRQNFG